MAKADAELKKGAADIKALTARAEESESREMDVLNLES